MKPRKMAASLNPDKHNLSGLALAVASLLSFLLLTSVGAQEELQQRLAAGEIIVSAQEFPAPP